MSMWFWPMWYFHHYTTDKVIFMWSWAMWYFHHYTRDNTKSMFIRTHMISSSLHYGVFQICEIFVTIEPVDWKLQRTVNLWYKSKKSWLWCASNNISLGGPTTGSPMAGLTQLVTYCHLGTIIERSCYNTTWVFHTLSFSLLFRIICHIKARTHNHGVQKNNTRRRQTATGISLGLSLHENLWQFHFIWCYPMTKTQFMQTRGVWKCVISAWLQLCFPEVMGWKQEPMPVKKTHISQLGASSDPGNHSAYGLILPRPWQCTSQFLHGHKFLLYC